MSQDIRDFVPPSCDLLALGEPNHLEPAYGHARNELFARLVDRGFRSIALETDRVPAFALDDHVRDGTGDFDETMREGIAFGRGDMAPNRELITWMREYNRTRPPEERLAFHGFDAEMENMSAPSPRRYLEAARAYLARDEGLASPLALAADPAVDIASLAGDDERWSRTEAVLDAACSIGATPEAEALRCIRFRLVFRRLDFAAAENDDHPPYEEPKPAEPTECHELYYANAVASSRRCSARAHNCARTFLLTTTDGRSIWFAERSWT